MSPLITAVVSVGAAAIVIMKPPPTDTDGVPHRYPKLAALTGPSPSHVRTVCAAAQQQLSTTLGRPWNLPPAARALPVLIHLRTNLTTRALAALFGTSQSTVDRAIHHLMPILARSLQPEPDHSKHPWIIDGTPDPGARSADHRHQQELPPPCQHPDHHLRSPAPSGCRQPMLARQPQRRHRGPPYRGSPLRQSCHPR
jgi:hypothetical protein